MGLRSAYKTNIELEKSGITLHYPHLSIKLLCRRAGGSNTSYNKAMEEVARTHKQAMANDLLSEEKGRAIIYDVYARHVILKVWSDPIGNDIEEDYAPGIEGADGEIVPATPEAIVAAFYDVPQLFLDIKNDVEGVKYFRQALIEETVKN